MLGLILGWCAAWAAPVVTELPNGVRVVTENTPATGQRVEVGWFTNIGSAHDTPGAVATALAAHQHGTSTVPASEVLPLWQQALGTTPTLHLCTYDAGSLARIDAADLEAWAWLTSDALADTRVTDPTAVHATALAAFPLRPFDGVDRAPAPASWPRVVSAPALDLTAVRDAVRDVAAAQHLVVIVRGDVDAQAAISTVAPYFERLSPSETQRPDSAVPTRTVDVRRVHRGSPTALLRMDIARDAASIELARTLDAHAAHALQDVAFDAHVTLHTDSTIWTLELDAQPAPGGAERVSSAWTAWLQTLQGTEIPAAAPNGPQTVIQLAHGVLYPSVPSQMTPEGVVAQLVGAPMTTVLSQPEPEDEAMDVIRRTVGELAAELVRIRLRELDTLPNDEIEGWVQAQRADRDAVAPRLRPALDLLIARAEERLP